MSAVDSAAIAIMWRARSSRPRTSPGDCAIGRPICRVSSSAITGPRASNRLQKRVRIAARTVTGTRRQSRCARFARSSAALTCILLACSRTATSLPSIGESVTWRLIR
jgi:hypothetical protein